MATLGTALMGALGHSDEEKMFRPWSVFYSHPSTLIEAHQWFVWVGYDGIYLLCLYIVRCYILHMIDVCTRWDALEDFVIYGLIMLGLIVRCALQYFCDV